MAVLPALQSKSVIAKAQRRQKAPLSVIPEAELTEERRAAEQQAAKSRKRAALPKTMRVITPCSTPHSSRTPALSPINEFPADSLLSEEEVEGK